LKLISLCSGKRQGLYAVDRRMDRELHCERKRMAGYVPAAFSIRSKCKTFSLVEIDLEQEVMRVARGKFGYWLTEDGLLLLGGWAQEGLTDEQMAEKMGIVPSTLYDWKNKFPKISEALKKGKEIVDIQVENALLKRALGYDYQEERVERSDKDGVKVIQTLKHVPPDTTAQIFWLKNRRPDKWRDKPVDVKEQTTVEDLTALAEKLRAE